MGEEDNQSMMSDTSCESDLSPATPLTRQTPARSTLVRRCHEYYQRRLEQTETLKRRWSMCECSSSSDSPSPPSSVNEGQEIERVEDEEGQRSEWPATNNTSKKTSFDIAMENLRKEITSLITQDNDLFHKLLTLHDAISELREQQQHHVLIDEPLQEDEEEELESSSGASFDDGLSESEDHSSTPASTLSSCSSHGISSSTERRQRPHTTICNTTDVITPVISPLPTDANRCWRCKSKGKRAPPLRRRARSYMSIFGRADDMDSYDSGIHLHGSHSDSDHEIFV